ncbi:uncharacterized protein LOC110980445 [Acanthaster planci]|uniref:Uncharacterized protein LOC110980445 n=1 Tax=Acanthaster planci TaxID=133434 RepID=A0A8B7YMX1_ACAPL|nr:uncharacterized protein LOC110980445 [Acanthaster planci]
MRTFLDQPVARKKMLLILALANTFVSMQLHAYNARTPTNHRYTPDQMCGFVDYFLKSPILNQSIVKTQRHCFSLCLEHPDCKSTNYFWKTHECVLNNVSHFGGTQALEMISGSFYAFTKSRPECSMGPTTEKTQAIWIEQELSLVGRSSQLSPFFRLSYGPERANDGHVNTLMTSEPYCAHTDVAQHPWWRVNLGGDHCLGRITIVTRGDCCENRLIGATVRVGLNSEVTRNMICGSAVTKSQAQPGAWIEFVCDPPTLARYVSVDANYGAGTDSLEICEVMVKEYVQEK